MRILVFCGLLLTLLVGHSAHGQLLADTLFSWRGYTQPGICGVTLYMNKDAAKKYTVILTELGENTGPATTSEIGYLAEHIGRTYNVDPTEAYWVVHWGHFSYNEARKSKKELFIRATFSRTSTQRIGAPQWKMINKEEIEKYTDRQFLKWKRR